MKTKNFKKPIALFLAVMLCASLLFSLGTTAFAAEETANVCLIAFPRDGDANYNGEWEFELYEWLVYQSIFIYVDSSYGAV